MNAIHRLLTTIITTTTQQQREYAPSEEQHHRRRRIAADFLLLLPRFSLPSVTACTSLLLPLLLHRPGFLPTTSQPRSYSCQHNQMTIAPITGKLRKRLILDLSVALGGGTACGYAFW